MGNDIATIFFACMLPGQVSTSDECNFCVCLPNNGACNFKCVWVLGLPQRWSHSARVASFLQRTKLFHTNLLHPENIVHVCQQRLCLCTMCIFFVAYHFCSFQADSRFFFLFCCCSVTHFNGYWTTHKCTVFHCEVCRFFSLSLLLTMLLGFNGWIGCCSCSRHSMSSLFPKNENQQANGEKQIIKNRDKNCAHIIFAKKKNDCRNRVESKMH